MPSFSRPAPDPPNKDYQGSCVSTVSQCRPRLHDSGAKGSSALTDSGASQSRAASPSFAASTAQQGMTSSPQSGKRRTDYVEYLVFRYLESRFIDPAPRLGAGHVQDAALAKT